MADRKISDMTALAAGSQATGDLIAVVDVSEAAAANKNKKMTMENLFKGIPGNVGVGTSTPSQKLTVKGIQNFEATNSTNGWYQYTNTDNTLRFNYNGSGNDEVTITSAGNVGIGTASPTELLQLNQSDSTGSAVHFTNSTTGATASDGLTVGIGDNEQAQFWLFENNYMRFATNNLERLRIDSSGTFRVKGAGTAGVSDAFAVNGSAPASSAQIDSSGRLLVGTSSAPGAGAWAQYARLVSNGNTADSTGAGILNLAPGKAAASIASGNGIGVISFSDNGGNEFGLIQCLADATAGSGDYPGRLVFSTTADSASSPTPNMKLASSGTLTIANNLSTTNYAMCHTNGFFQAERTSGTNTLFQGILGGVQNVLITANGNATFAGALSKGSGSFRISHPLPEKADTHYLYHSFIEGPQADLIYRGHVQLVNGTACVNIDEAARMTEGTFEALCTNVCCFTSNESDWTAVRGSVSGNILTIEAQDSSSTADVCWMVVGERKDQHMLDTAWTDENGRVITERPKSEVDSPEVA